MQLISKNVLVTGAAGFIGMHYCEALLKRNVKVHGIDNLNAYYNPLLKRARLDKLNSYKNFVFTQCNIESSHELNELIRETRPCLIVNLAAQAGVRYSLENPHQYISTNVTGFLNILEAVRYLEENQRPPILYASSSSVYGNGSNGQTNQENAKVRAFREDDPIGAPISLYASTKITNELLASTYSHLFGLHLIGLRFFTVYGPWGRPDMAPFLFSKAILTDKPIKLFNRGDLRRDFTYIGDIVRNMMILTERLLVDVSALFDKATAKNLLLNIGNGNPTNLLEFVNQLELLLGRQAKKEYFPMQPGDVYSTHADCSRIVKITGDTTRTPLSTGLEEFTSWFLEHSSLALEC